MHGCIITVWLAASHKSKLGARCTVIFFGCQPDCRGQRAPFLQGWTIMWIPISRRSFMATASALIAWPGPWESFEDEPAPESISRRLIAWPATRESSADEPAPESESLWWEEPEPNRGESCFAISLMTFPLNWRPQSADAIPPQWRPFVIAWSTRNLAPIARDVLKFNASRIEEWAAGETPDAWAVAVSMIYPIDATARPVEIGGAL